MIGGVSYPKKDSDKELDVIREFMTDHPTVELMTEAMKLAFYGADVCDADATSDDTRDVCHHRGGNFNVHRNRFDETQCINLPMFPRLAQASHHHCPTVRAWTTCTYDTCVS